MSGKGNTQQIVDHLFRNEYGKIVSLLVSKYGANHLTLTEDVVQEAMYKAMQTWPYGEVPANPAGWIYRVSNNQMIDQLRRLSKQDYTEESHLDLHQASFETDINPDDVLKDELLKMLFACCHPELHIEFQIILALKVLCGLGVKEIAACLLKSEAAVAKSYTRSRQKLIEVNASFDLPPAGELKNRLSVVLKVIYLLFNEGYKPSQGKKILNVDLCIEALRLNKLLLDAEIGNLPETNALEALMYFHLARSESRMSEGGFIISLEDQDRSTWDQEMIQTGHYFLNRAVQEPVYSEYHIQAVISSLHCAAKSFEATNWNEILALYDAMVLRYPSAVAQLNRLVPLAQVKGWESALVELTKIEETGFLSNYYLLYLVKGHLLEKGKKIKPAVKAYKEGLELIENELEKKYIAMKIQRLSKV
ncbi:RNA polymerase sigma-70 factor, ECF subfamily [Reichenbachiella faecimaris]|uniref:RNA polymerase sigma-70 factor, ECF subfamily n=1 Tax=Reichenbachiella faecimaris TaxID=692418 RepID=A0A1W2GQJ3_REIFA|nr:sigma-70 family RNA polymerase sigma factor [Reichenbachiella faecimaris]SMD38692.1 RNA polymerase sigma-70 factor, ECF subfamily [Reichenbachiella faecimaris]